MILQRIWKIYKIWVLINSELFSEWLDNIEVKIYPLRVFSHVFPSFKSQMLYV